MSQGPAAAVEGYSQSGSSSLGGSRHCVWHQHRGRSLFKLWGSAETLATLPGKVLWTARRAMWVTSCLFRFNVLPDKRKYHTFLSVSAQKLMEPVRWLGASNFSSYYQSVRYAILELLNTGTLVPRLFMGDWFFTQQGSERSKRRRLDKEARVAPAEAELQPYLSGDWLLFYTDGSSVPMDLVGWVGGFGVHCP